MQKTGSGSLPFMYLGVLLCNYQLVSEHIYLWVIRLWNSRGWSSSLENNTEQPHYHFGFLQSRSSRAVFRVPCTGASPHGLLRWFLSVFSESWFPLTFNINEWSQDCVTSAPFLGPPILAFAIFMLFLLTQSGWTEFIKYAYDVTQFFTKYWKHKFCYWQKWITLNIENGDIFNFWIIPISRDHSGVFFFF